MCQLTAQLGSALQAQNSLINLSVQIRSCIKGFWCIGGLSPVTVVCHGCLTVMHGAKHPEFQAFHSAAELGMCRRIAESASVTANAPEPPKMALIASC